MDISNLTRKFHVIAVISNPVRYESRVRLYRDFEKHMACSGAQLWTVEIAFGDRPFQATCANDPRDIQFRSFHEIWHKENMINLALARLPSDWEYVAWIDADVMFQRMDWVKETVQQLQHFNVLQLFGHCIDLGPKGEPMQTHRSFVKGWIDNNFKCPNRIMRPGTVRNADRPFVPEYDPYEVVPGVSGSFAHTGYAWAARREVLEETQGLMDFAILGSADHHMAMAMVGEVEKTFPSQIHSKYAQKLLQWQDRALKYIKKDIGYVEGTILHSFHGKKRDRRYTDRWSILTKNNYDPNHDIKRDTQGLWMVTDENIRLRDEIRAYFRARNEDSIDL